MANITPPERVYRSPYYAENRKKILARMAEDRRANPEKHKARKATYYRANRDRVIAKSLAWREANLEKAIANDAKRYAAQKDKMLARNAAWRKTNTDVLRASLKKWREKNKEKAVAMTAAWHVAHPEAKRVYKARRSALKVSAGGKHTRADIMALMSLQGGRCPVCHSSLEDGYHVDHIEPLTRGGSNDRLNLQLLCRICNISKGAKPPIDFMQARGFLL